MSEPLETAEFLAFAKTVEAKSLSRAAAELGVPRATISRRLARLEERLGARLLRRTTRSLVLTDAGEALYRHARIVLDAVGDAEASVRQTDDAVRGDLRVSVPGDLPPSFYAMICEFAARYPDVRLQVHASSRRVDLVRDGYDVALRASIQLEPGLIARRIASDRLIAVASPAYLDAHGVPATRRDLAHHRCLMGFARGELPQTHWPLGGDSTMQVEGALFTNDLRLLVESAARGLGIAMLPRMFVVPLLERGALVQVLPGTLEVDSTVAVVYPERELMPPQVRVFVEAIVAWGKAELDERAISTRCAEALTAASGRDSKARSTPSGDRSRAARRKARR